MCGGLNSSARAMLCCVHEPRNPQCFVLVQRLDITKSVTGT